MLTDLLIVDDDTSQSVRLLEIFLGRQGYTIRNATSTADAERILRESPPEILLVDTTSPNLDGGAWLRGILSGASLKNLEGIRVVPMISREPGEDEAELGDGWRAAGCRDILTKPFDFHDMTEVLDRISGRGV